jgi:hypothetical protein
MFRFSFSLVRASGILFLLIYFSGALVMAQVETATVSGEIVDSSGLRVAGVRIDLIDIDRGTSTTAATDNSGFYRFASVSTGRYRMQVRAAGFRVIDITGLIVNVQDHLEQNFKLSIGSVLESVTVEGGAPLVDTETAAVSTVVDRNFAENLPMNGRSFQTLVQLTPGAVLTAGNSNDSGQFSINGQRAAANYWMVDGVSANIGVGTNFNPGNGMGGALGSFSVLGGTNSLVSTDAMQEFRIQTSTFAPEFGRTPGGQISVVTRSGANELRGTVFDYLKNDVFDASNWFNGYFNNPPLPKSQERQNDFGGTISGPILKDKTFFFFSYEGLRLRLPQTSLTTVPDLGARRSAIPAMIPFLDAYPLPNGADIGSGIALFDSSYSNPASLNAYSLRIDHRVSNRLLLFARYDYSPSSIDQRGGSASSLSTINTKRISTQTGTVGATGSLSSVTNEFRFNYSSTDASSQYELDNFGGAIPLKNPPFPSPPNVRNSLFNLNIGSLQQGQINIGAAGQNVLRQTNIVDSISLQKNSHSLKFGFDFRRLAPLYAPSEYNQSAQFLDIASSLDGSLEYDAIASNLQPTLLFRNLGAYAQDTWRIFRRLTATYGLRWDVDFVPKSIRGPNFSGVSGFNLDDLSQLGLDPGAPPYMTTYSNVAPRVGVAYEFSDRQGWQTVLRGGFGIFYDLATSEFGNQIFPGNYPFGSLAIRGGIFPLDSASAAPLPIEAPNATNFQVLVAFDPRLQLPRTYEWNLALELGLGQQQTLSASYIGAAGRQLLQSAEAFAPNANIGTATFVTNAGSSDYDALQLQFHRRAARGLQALVSYTWSHSIDTSSAGSTAIATNSLVPAAMNANRGPSDFDVRSSLAAALTFDVPDVTLTSLQAALLSGWSVDSIVEVHTATPTNISDSNFFELKNFLTGVRPDLVQGQPYYLFGAQYPGGKAFNSAAFIDPPSTVDPLTGITVPLRQGNAPRNFLRGFGAVQWDLAVHRTFPIHDLIKLQFRAEMFNGLNHPNFGPPNGCFGLACNGTFGISNQMLGQYLSGGTLGNGSFSPLYQIGGPRSIQLALKLTF